MHLFTRTRRIAPGHTGDALTAAIALAQEASSTSGSTVSPWINVYGAPPDSVSFVACVDSQAGIEHALAAECFVGVAADTIGEFVSCTRSRGPAPSFAAIVTAQCEPGRVADAIAWAVDTGNDIARLTGLRTAVVRELYGPWATLSRITLAQSMADLDDAEEKLVTDLNHLERVDECAGWFVPGTVEQRLMRRLR